MEHEQLQREAALQAVGELPRHNVLSLGMLAAIGTVMGGGTAAEQVRVAVKFVVAVDTFKY
jgi:hypothetical protein